MSDNQNEMAGLDELQPETEEIRIKGEIIEVKPFKFKHFLKITKLLAKLVEGVDFLSTSGIIFALAENEDVIYQILEMATGKSRDFFDDETLEADSMFALLAMTWKVNQDFFSQKVSPSLKRVLGENHGLFGLLSGKANEMSQEIDSTLGQM